MLVNCWNGYFLLCFKQKPYNFPNSFLNIFVFEKLPNVKRTRLSLSEKSEFLEQILLSMKEKTVEFMKFQIILILLAWKMLIILILVKHTNFIRSENFLRFWTFSQTKMFCTVKIFQNPKDWVKDLWTDKWTKWNCRVAVSKYKEDKTYFDYFIELS